MRQLEPTAQLWNSDKNSRSLTLVSGNISYMRIFAGVPLGRGIKWQWGCRRRQFLEIWVATSSETSKIRLAVCYMTICYPLLACDWLQNEWPRMTLSGYFMSKSVFGHFLTHSVWLSKIIAWKVINIDPYYQRQECRSTSLISSNKNVSIDIRRRFLQERLQIWVGSFKSTYWQLSRCYIFVSFVDTPFLIPAVTNDLECPIQLKVRFPDGTLDVRVLWLLELAMRVWMYMGLNCQRQKCGQWTVVSQHMVFVWIFAGVYCRGSVEPELSR